MKTNLAGCVVLFAVALGGCAPDAADQVRVRAANDFRCNDDKVSVKDIGGEAYRADGCGQSRVYDCSPGSSWRGTTTDYSCHPER